MLHEQGLQPMLSMGQGLAINDAGNMPSSHYTDATTFPAGSKTGPK